MSRSGNKRIIVTMGDPCGVGPEVTAGALAVLASCRRHRVEFIVIGHEAVFMRSWPRGLEAPSLIHIEGRGKAVHVPGKPTPSSGEASLRYLQCAVDILKAGGADALVTGPVSKEAVAPFAPGFRGHTTFLADSFGRKNVEMLFVVDDLRMVLVTRHIPLKDVAPAVTAAKVFSVVNVSAEFLRAHFGLPKPRVAVCGLNPHAGEGGHMGSEEKRTIVPAIARLRRKGWDVTGPWPADTLMEPAVRAGHDLIVSMYHDQVLPVFKAMHFHRLVNVTAGLPFIRTSPAHGTAFLLAGRKKADHGSMLAALKLAAGLATGHA